MAGWTDYIADWSSKDKLRLCSVYDALSALTAAVNERLSVLIPYIDTVGYFPITSTVPLKGTYGYFNDHLNRYSEEGNKNFLSLLKIASQKYVDTISNGGIYFYPNGGIPTQYFSWNTLLCGETEISPAYLIDSADLIFQYYKIINRLKYIQYDGSNLEYHWVYITQNNPLIKATVEIYKYDNVWSLDSEINTEHTLAELKEMLSEYLGNSFRYVFKFTGANGFQFKDW